jgi:hypothetical protein
MKKRMYISHHNLHPTVHTTGQLEVETVQVDPNKAVEFIPDFLKDHVEVTPFNLFPEETAVEEEPAYTDIDEYGNEVAKDGHTPAWKMPKGEFTQEAFDACHIKLWGNQNQKSRWGKIQTELFSKYGQEVKIRRAWITEEIKWAKEKNLGRHVVAIIIDSLMSAIGNDTLYEEFKMKYFQKGKNSYAQ